MLLWGLYKNVTHNVNSWMTAILPTSDDVDTLCGMRAWCASMAAAMHDAMIDAGNAALARGFKPPWSTRGPNVARNITYVARTRGMRWVPGTTLTKANAIFGGQATADAISFDVHDVMAYPSLAWARSIRATSLPRWVSWWDLARFADVVPASQKTPKVALVSEVLGKMSWLAEQHNAIVDGASAKAGRINMPSPQILRRVVASIARAATTASVWPSALPANLQLTYVVRRWSDPGELVGDLRLLELSGCGPPSEHVGGRAAWPSRVNGCVVRSRRQSGWPCGDVKQA